MALFGRRELQRRLDIVAQRLGKSTLLELAHRLNLKGRDALRAEWELVWLAAFAEIGVVSHAHNHSGGTSFPDISFSNGEIEFIADVTAVSDQGYDEQNPVNELREALSALYVKYGLTHGGFRLTFPSRMEKKGERNTPRVILPPRSQIRDFVRRYFEPLVREIVTQPESRHFTEASISNKTPDVIRLEYDPARRPGNEEGGHYCYDLPYSARENPIFRGLKEKRNQLAVSGYNGLKGILVCDGDCATLGRYEGIRGFSGCSLDTIIAEFFRQHSSVAFVVTAGVRTNLPHVSGRGALPLSLRIFFHPRIRRDLQAKITTTVTAACRHLPRALWSPENALRILQEGSPPKLTSLFSTWLKCSASFSMKKADPTTEVSLPARTVIALLSGEIDMASYQQALKRRYPSSPSPAEIISQSLRSGQKLAAMHLERGNLDDDDDTITFSFKGYDAGGAKYRLP